MLVVDMSTNNLNLRSILESNKLIGPNFMDWMRNLKIVVRVEKLGYVLDTPFPKAPNESASRAAIAAYEKHKESYDSAQCIMLASMNSELQKQCEKLDAYTMIMYLKELFEAQARSERYDVSKELFRCKMAEGSSVASHGIKMLGLINRLKDLGFSMDTELSTDLILQSLPDSFSQFVMNFNMNKIEVPLTELIKMLKSAEDNIKKERGTTMLINSSKTKKRSNANLKKVKQKKKMIKASGGVKKDKTKDKGTCFHCGKDGHWKRNCKVYLDSLKQKKHNDASTSGILMIEILSTSKSSSWVLDTGSPSHICNNMQELRQSRSLARGEVDLRVGNGARVAAIAVGTYYLPLPSGHVLQLNNCYYVPVLTRNIISISRLDLEGFTIEQKNNCCSISHNEMLHATAPSLNGHYILNISDPILNINTKKRKIDNENSSYLWHCRLGHVNKKRISQLYKNGYLGSLDYESYETCESCLLGKMTKTPFSGKGERATELLGIIHSDVCGPMSITARGGYSYFITFTDDHSRYGYVYLMKYKSEAFEKFKEYKSDVEKQLDKSIKILRSDRGGEYLSDEFQDYLKKNGIVPQRTPPYTPQLNGVSERRNRTLLDMVRSMMSHAHLPKSFWGYALETASYILNHVPTKTVDSTPYEIWKRKKPNLKYMKIWGCPAFVKRVDSDKLEAKSDKCVFVGYPKESYGY